MVRIPSPHRRIAQCLHAASFLCAGVLAGPPAPLAADGQWSTFDVFSRPIVSDEVATYDASNDRMVAFGGTSGPNTFNNAARVLSLGSSPTWSPLITQGRPPDARNAPTGVYDPVRQRLLVFGGSNSFGYLNDVWELSLGNPPVWKKLSPTGTLPTGRANHTAIYDALNDRMIVFGGEVNSGGATSNEVWALSLSPVLGWVKLDPAGVIPTGRSGHVAIYDPVRHRMVVFGGGPAGNDLWELSITGVPTWSLIFAAGTEPPGLSGETAIYDPGANRLLVHGGLNQVTGQPSSSTWSLSLAGTPTWSQVTAATTPPARNVHVAIHDPLRNRMIVSGGSTSDSWALSLGGTPAWSDLYTAGTAATISSGFDAILSAYDGARRRWVFVESPVTPNFVTNSGWYLSLDEPVGWKRVVATGEPTNYTFAPITFFDPVGDRLIAFFGSDTSTWTITLGDPIVWTKITTLTPNVGLSYSSYARAYDRARNRWLIFGGTKPNGLLSNEVWALSLAGTPAWSQILPSGTPPLERSRSALVYDPVSDRLVMFGGAITGGSSPTAIGDSWQLTLSGTPTWTQLATSTPPPVRFDAGFFYDSTRDRDVLTAGRVAGGGLVDTWTFATGHASGWTQLATTVASGLPAAIQDYDAPHDRGLLFSIGPSVTMMALSFGAPAAPDIACPSNLPASVAGVNLVNYLLTNRQPGSETYDFQINSARNWPSFPLRGRTTMSGFSSQYLPVGIPVPDTVAGSTNQLTIVAWRRGDTSVTDSCSHLIGAPTVGVQVALQSLSVQPGIVKLAWLYPDAAIENVTAFRREPPDAWTARATLVPGSDGLVHYEDAAVIPGHRYAYRLGYTMLGASTFTPEVRVDVPGATLSFLGATPNPAFERLRITFMSPRDEPVRAEVFDLMGRLVIARELAGRAGLRVVDLAEGGRLAAGIYVVRLTEGGESRSGRAVYLR